MKLMKLFILMVVSGLFINSYAQQLPNQKASNQKKVVRLNPVKPDTNDPNKKALNKFSKEKMFNVSTPPKQMKPEEIRAMNFFNDGSKKGKAGKYDDAIIDFTKSLDLVKGANTYVKRGYAYQMVGNYGAAIQDETEALHIDQSLLKAYFIRGISRYETGDFKGAKEDLFIFLDHDRTNPIAFNYMAALMFMNQNYKGSLENYDEVVKIDPKYPDIYTNRGMMRHYVQDYKGAVLDYGEALKLNPENATALNNRGAARLMLKELQSALADLNKAIRINEKYADAYDNRGKVKQAMGDTNGACADWQKAYSYGLEASKELIIKFCK